MSNFKGHEQISKTEQEDSLHQNWPPKKIKRQSKNLFGQLANKILIKLKRIQWYSNKESVTKWNFLKQFKINYYSKTYNLLH